MKDPRSVGQEFHGAARRNFRIVGVAGGLSSADFRTKSIEERTMRSDRTNTRRSGRITRSRSLMLRFTSGNRGKATQNIACISLWPFAIFLSGSLHAAEVRHACDAQEFQPCPSYSVKVEVKEHATLFESRSFGYARSKGAWTVHVKYQPANECARVSLFVDIGPLEFDRVYKRIFVDGGGKIEDSGVFMYEIGRPDSALGVTSSSCFVPKKQTELSGSPDPTQNSFDRELARQRDEFALDDAPVTDLDETLQRLARQEEQGYAARGDLSTQRETTEITRDRANSQEEASELDRLDREIQEILQHRRNQERVGEIERQQDDGEGFKCS